MYAVGLDNLFNIAYFTIACSSYSTHATPINETLHQVLFGTMLGDGQLTKDTRSINARFSFIQSQNHRAYFMTVYELFAAYCGSPFVETETYDARTGNTYYALVFRTLVHSSFTAMYQLFYING